MGWKTKLRRPAAMYLLAVASTLLALGVRVGFMGWFGDRPVLVLFVVPVIISAYAGGLGPGLLATALAGLEADFFLIPPRGSLLVERPVDFVQWLLLVSCGVLISLLSERLHRTRRRAEKLAGEARDAEARARAGEEKLRVQESLMRETGHIAKVGGWGLDVATGKGFWTEEVARIHDMDPGEEISKNKGLDFYLPESRVQIERAVREAIEHGTSYDLRLEIRTLAGRHKWVRTIGHPVMENGKITALRGSFQDISELQESEERFSKGFRSSPVAMVIIRRRDRVIIEVNEAFTRFYGSPREEIVGRSIEEMVLLAPEELERVRQEVRAGGGLGSQEMRLQTRAGGVRQVVGSTERIELGGEPCLLSTLFDLTERKKLEGQLLQAQKMEALGRLSGGIAHDFNNMLAAITGNAHLALEDLPAGHPARESVTEIDKAANRACDLVRRILTFSRQQPSERHRLQLEGVVEEAVKLLRASLPAMIEIRVRSAPGLPAVSADPTQVHQVVMNLGANAAYAMRERGGLLEFVSETVVLNPQAAGLAGGLRPGRYVRLCVRDTGCGMDKATQDRVFEPFFTTKPIGEGTGLGLAVVHGILKGHEGGIVVSSQPGRGTEFELYFPVCEQAGVAMQVSGVCGLNGQGERILYVDDEQSLVFLIKRMLERHGYKVSGYVKPEEALRAFEARPSDFDAVVSDCSMPGMSGFELASRVLAIRPGCPFILTSGHVREQDLAAAAQAGVRHLIAKPDTVAELKQALHEILSQNRAKGFGQAAGKPQS